MGKESPVVCLAIRDSVLGDRVNRLSLMAEEVANLCFCMESLDYFGLLGPCFWTLGHPRSDSAIRERRLNFRKSDGMRRPVSDGML